MSIESPPGQHLLRAEGWLMFNCARKLEEPGQKSNAKIVKIYNLNVRDRKLIQIKTWETRF